MRPEPKAIDLEFPGRYGLDEARFPGGSAHIRNKEEMQDGSTADLA